MKNKIFIHCLLAAAVVFSISSCKKFLSQVPDDKLTIDDVFKKEIDHRAIPG